MSTTSDFFTGDTPRGDTPHSQAKRIMLKKCLQAFVPVSYHRTTPKFGKMIDGFVIIDGFAGEGKYGEGWPREIDQYGSPLIALMVTLNYFYYLENKRDKVWNIGEEFRRDIPFEDNKEDAILNPISIPDKLASLLFVEENRQRFYRLVSNIDTVFNFFKEPYSVSKIGSRCFILNGKNISCTIWNCTFADFSDSFPNTRLPRRAFFTFIDPFGYSQTPMKSIKKFVGDENQTFLMNFMSGPVNRFVSKQPTHVAKLYGISLPRRLNNMTYAQYTRELGDDLKEQIRRRPSGFTMTTGNIQNCAVNFQMALERESGQDLSLLFEMRGEGNVAIYHLVLLTGHPKPYQDMKEAMNRVTQYEREMKFSDFDIIRKGKTVNLSNLQDKSTVADDIFERYKGESISIEEIQRFVMLETPFVFRKKALAFMEKERKRPRITEVEGGTRKRKRYTYPDGTNWTITFRE